MSDRTVTLSLEEISALRAVIDWSMATNEYLGEAEHDALVACDLKLADAECFWHPATVPVCHELPGMFCQACEGTHLSQPQRDDIIASYPSAYDPDFFADAIAAETMADADRAMQVLLADTEPRTPTDTIVNPGPESFTVAFDVAIDADGVTAVQINGTDVAYIERTTAGAFIMRLVEWAADPDVTEGADFEIGANTVVLPAP